MALEHWARQTDRHLANSQVMNAEFPLCLSEALHGAKALKAARAERWRVSSAGFEPTGSEGVLQAARRPSPGSSCCDVWAIVSTLPKQRRTNRWCARGQFSKAA